MSPLVVSLTVTLAIQAMVSMAVFAPPVLAPVAAPDIGIGAAGAGVSTALIYLTATVSALASGGLIGRLGPLRVSQCSLALVAAGMGAMALGHLATVALGALLIGFGYGVVTPASSVLLNERTPPRWRAFVFSLKQTGVPIGGALAGALIPPLLLAAGWREAALVVAVACVVLIVLVQPARADSDRGRDPHRAIGGIRLREPMRLVWAHRDLREMALASFGYSGMQMCLGSYLVVCLHEVAGVSVAAAGAALSVAMAGGIVGRVGWGIVADHLIPPRRMLGLLGVGMSLGAFTLWLLGPQWPWAAVLVFAFLFGATAVGWNGVYLSQVALVAPKGRAADATGASLAMTYLGVVVTPLVVWTLATLGLSYGAGFIVIGLITAWRCAYFFRG